MVRPVMFEPCFTNFIFKTDCLAIAQIWQYQRRYLHAVMGDCRLTMNGLSTHTLAHAKSKCNMTTDCMSMYAFSFPYNLWIEDGPNS